jgi:hypothetical protein
MIRFASQVIEVGKLFPKVEKRQKFVKVALLGGSLFRLKAIEELATRLHNQWAESFRASAMVKGDKNPTRMKDDGMGGQVDILNTDYSKLPQKWQAENEAQAVAAINLVMKAGNDAKKQLESLAAEVHEQWLSRNTWAKDGPLGVSYGELPEEEKQKDRDVILQAIEVLALNNLSPLPEYLPEEMSEEMPEEMPEDDKY